MKIRSAALGTALFTLIVPSVVAGVVPSFIAPLSSQTPAWAMAAGWLSIAAGTCGYLWCALDFVRYGLGTPAPVAAPDELVVRGLYHYTRNPMYVSVLLVIIGQAGLRWSAAVLLYGALVLLAVSVFVRFYEEPALTRKFGSPYLRYRAAVPRWLGPRRMP